MQIRSDHCYWLSEFIVAISQWLFLFWKDLRFCFQRNEAGFKIFQSFFYVDKPVAVYINIYWESKTASPKYFHFCMLSWCDFLIINSETREWSPKFFSCKSTFIWFFTIWVLGVIFPFSMLKFWRENSQLTHTPLKMEHMITFWTILTDDSLVKGIYGIIFFISFIFFSICFH